MDFERNENTLERLRKISIFDFTDYSEYLNSYVNEYGKYSHGPFNLKNWAKRLGYRSASSLAMVLNKQRIPTWKMIASLSEDFKLSKNERKYFELLVDLERKKQAGEPIHEILKETHRLSGLKEYQQINFDQFVVISDWHCYVIKRLVSNKNFIDDLDWIYRALRRKVTKAKIKESIDSLISVGMLSRDDKGQLVDSNPQTHTGNQIPSAAIRNHHKGMLMRGIEAIEEQDVSSRMFQGLTLNMKKDADLESAFEDIKKFINKFNKKYSKDGAGDSVYQLSMMLYEHTDISNEVEQ